MLTCQLSCVWVGDAFCSGDFSLALIMTKAMRERGVTSAGGSGGACNCWEGMAWWQEQAVPPVTGTGSEVRPTKPVPWHRGMGMG